MLGRLVVPQQVPALVRQKQLLLLQLLLDHHFVLVLLGVSIAHRLRLLEEELQWQVLLLELFVFDVVGCFEVLNDIHLFHHTRLFVHLLPAVQLWGASQSFFKPAFELINDQKLVARHRLISTQVIHKFAAAEQHLFALFHIFYKQFPAWSSRRLLCIDTSELSPKPRRGEVVAIPLSDVKTIVGFPGFAF